MATKRKRPKKVDRRLEISPTASSAGMGPLTFDLALARCHGWTESELARAWAGFVKVYLPLSRLSTKRHPELYKVVAGTEIFIGPDKDGKRLKL